MTSDLAFQTWQNTRDWLDQCTAIFLRNAGSEEADGNSELLWRILICNKNIEGGPPDAYTRDWYLAFCQIYALDGEVFKRRGFDETTVWAGYFESATGRAFFATQKRHLGWAPKCADPGDLVCVFPGAEVPYILRSVGDQGQFRMIGECYIHGFMNGEAMSMNALAMYQFQLC